MMAWRRICKARCLAVAAACYLFAALPSDVLASTCTRFTPEQTFREAHGIFVGVPLERRVLGDRTNWRVEFRFSVVRVLKGEVPEPEIVLPYRGPAPFVPVRDDGTAIYFTETSALGETYVSACLTRDGANNAAAMQAIFDQYRAGLVEVDRQIRDHPDEIAHRLARAAFFEQWGEAGRSIGVYAEISARWPSDARGWYGQGRLLLLREREFWGYSNRPSDVAVAPLTRALELNPDNTETRVLLAEARLRAGDARGFDGFDLRGLRLGFVDFSGQVLAGRDLSDIYWSQMSLSGADLRGSTVERASFNSVNLTRAQLRDAPCRSCPEEWCRSCG